MRSVDKLRWGLAGGSLALLVVLIGYVGYGRYRALKMWKSRLDRLGVHVDRTTDGFTYSQSLQGRTVFTVHAAKAVQHAQGKYTLHDGVLTLYGHGENNVDRIYGAEFEYDANTGVARAIGDAEIDVSLPNGVKKKGELANPSKGTEADDSSSEDNTVHVKTSGLVYVRKLGVAATDQQVEFRYAGLECTAKGAEFNTSESTVHLLADVQLHGDVRGRPIQLHASKADLQRSDNILSMVNPVVNSRDQKIRAEHADVHFRPDGSVETLLATGNVVMEKGTRHVTAARVDSTFSRDNLPQTAKLTGGVALDDSDPANAMHATANEAESTFSASGAPLTLVAFGGVQFQGSSQNKAGQVLSRGMRGTRLDASFQPVKRKSELKQVHITGGAQVSSEQPASGGSKRTFIAADDLRGVFYPGAQQDSQKNPEVQTVLGDGHTRLEQTAPGGEQQISTGDKLELQFAPQVGTSAQQIAKATQTGHVQVHSQAATRLDKQAQKPAVASAERSTYDGATQKLTLSGDAKLTQEDSTISANTIVADQKSGDSDAEGSVMATFASAERKGDASHISAESAHLQRGTQIATFHGSDARPARMWQSASQIDAATLILNGKQKTLAARPERSGGVIHALFPSAKASAANTNAEPSAARASQGTQVARITANSMDYDDGARNATFSGSVRIDGASGVVQAKHAVAFLTPPTTASTNSQGRKSATAGIDLSGGSLQRIVIWDDVHLQQPGRSGRGDRLVYTTTDSSFVLTGTPGHPPQIVDAEKGNVTGTALLFNNSDNTIIVSGGNGGSISGAQPDTRKGERGHLRTGSGAKQ